jgi:hypothetical protein
VPFIATRRRRQEAARRHARDLLEVLPAGASLEYAGADVSEEVSSAR